MIDSYDEADWLDFTTAFAWEDWFAWFEIFDDDSWN